MTLYIAGSSLELPRAEQAVGAARAHGLEVSFDWTPGANMTRARWSSDEHAPQLVRFASAKNCHRGVVMADVFWLLAPTMPTRGAWVELGMALERERLSLTTVVVSGSPTATCFLELVDRERCFANDWDALSWILRDGRGA